MSSPQFVDDGKYEAEPKLIATCEQISTNRDRLGRLLVPVIQVTLRMRRRNSSIRMSHRQVVTRVVHAVLHRSCASASVFGAAVPGLSEGPR